MKAGSKKQFMLLYVLVCVLITATVVNLVALPKLNKAQEAKEQQQNAMDRYYAANSDRLTAVGLEADSQQLREKLEQLRTENGAFTGKLTAAQADGKVSPLFEKYGFELSELSISDETPWEEEFGEKPDGKGADKSEQTVLSGVTFYRMDYTVSGDSGDLPDLLGEISKAEGCCVGEVNGEFTADSSRQGELSSRIKAEISVYVFMLDEDK